MIARRLSLLALLVLPACDAGRAAPASGQEEPPLLRITAWTDRFEVFLEHPPLVAGAPTSLAFHVTDLKTFGPRRTGTAVLVVARAGAPALERELSGPRKPGIYPVDLVFAEPGEYAASLRLAVDGRDAVVALPPFKVHDSAEEAGKAPLQPAPDGIVLLKEQQWRLALKSEPVMKRTLVERVRVPAGVLARPGSRASVVPPMAGRLMAPEGKGLPDLGERVEAGQLLALVRPPVTEHAARLVEARAETIRAKLSLDQGELTLARVRKLAEAGARTERELQEAEFAARGAKASHDAARALEDAYGRSGFRTIEGGHVVLELRAPIGGVVVAVDGTVGEQVPADRPVIGLLDASKVHLEARVPEAELGRIATGSPAIAEAPGARGAFVSLEGKARRIFLGLEVDPATRTVPLRFEVANAEGSFRIGSVWTLHLETAQAVEALAVPGSAVVEEDARPVAFVHVSGETFEKRYLRLGVREGSWVEVREGLAEGDRVVTKEAMAVRLASVSNVVPAHGHAH
jgi:cobalt-zinc-cadmium efflux system membrane fusion protein